MTTYRTEGVKLGQACKSDFGDIDRLSRVGTAGKVAMRVAESSVEQVRCDRGEKWTTFAQRTSIEKNLGHSSIEHRRMIH
jgi:hypothetical protein